MLKKDIKKLRLETISYEMFDKIESSRDVVAINDCGMSGINPDFHLWEIVFTDESTIDVYTKTEVESAA